MCNILLSHLYRNRVLFFQAALKPPDAESSSQVATTVCASAGSAFTGQLWFHTGPKIVLEVLVFADSALN